MLEEYAIRVLALFSVYKRMDAANRLEDINVAATPFAKSDEQQKIFRIYEMASKDPRDILNLDDDGDMIRVKEVFR